MIWAEQRIRDDIERGNSLSWQEKKALLDEIDMLRETLRKIKTRAGSNSVVRKLVKEALEC